jgi:hypothetical protein
MKKKEEAMEPRNADGFQKLEKSMRRDLIHTSITHWLLGKLRSV